MKTLSHLAG